MDGETDSVDMPRTTIRHVPLDVLLLILRDVYAAASKPQILSKGDKMILDPWDPDGLKYSDTPAPECLASVCPIWREAMSHISVFWSHLVIWTGRDPTPLSRIRQYLLWSRNHSLDIFIIRRFDVCTDDPTEKNYVRAVIELLLPHMERWRILCMKLLHSSSLPIPCVDLVGQATQLSRLNLDFMIDDLLSGFDAALSLGGEFDTPVLETLSVGGAHFCEAYIKRTKSSLSPRLLYLAVTDYDSRLGPFQLCDLLTCLTWCEELSSIKLDNLHLEHLDTVPPLPYEVVVDWEVSVDFIAMSGDVIAEYCRLLSHPYVEFMSYIRCQTPVPPGALLAASYHVVMNEVHNPEALCTLLTATRTFLACFNATFTDCDGLTTDVLRRLTKPTIVQGGEDTDATETWLAPNVQWLTITRCKHFRSTDLRALLEARYKAHEATYFAEQEDPEYVVSSLERLYVTDCCELAAEDKEWFHENLVDVQWDDWSGGT